MERIFRIHFVKLIIYITTSIFFNSTGFAQWTQIGPFGGSVNSFAVIGSDIFAATDNSGIFCSSNNGTSWIQIDSGLTNHFFSSLVTNGTELFAGSYYGGGGVFRSTDNGVSWKQVNSGLTDTYVSALIIKGSNVFAGT